ncbi:MAG: hypothetical protein WCH11_06455, partial [Bdellovibrio sp.]
PNELRLGTQTAFALNYNYTPKLRMKLDLLSDPSHGFRKPEVLAGVETYVTQWWVLRAGFGMDFLRQSRRQGLGVGFVGPRFSLHYAQTQASASSPETPTELARNAQNEHVFDLLLSIW